MSITMVLADDEGYVLKSEEMFIRREFPEIELVGMAENGIELKTMLEELKPDLAMIDIRMPGLSGLEVVELLKHQGEVMTHFIINTAYSDFDYVKRALNLKTDAYFLKPCKKIEKIEVIKRLCLLVEEEKKTRKERQALMDVLPMLKNVLGSEILQSVISGQCDEEGFFRYCEMNHMEHPSGCILTLIPKRKAILERSEILNAIEKGLGEHCYYLVTVTDFGIVLMYLLEQDMDPEEQKNWCGDLTFLLLKNLEMVCRQEFLYGIGGIYSDFLQMPVSYKESVTDLKQGGFLNISDLRYPEEAEGKDKSDFYMDKAIRYLQKNYQKDLSLTDCAENVGISPYYLSHLFPEQSGKTFIEYLSWIRIEEAKRLIQETDMTIKELGEKVGYQNTTYFSKVFKRMTGYTVSEYRKNVEI